jgi:hypothetical protein
MNKKVFLSLLFLFILAPYFIYKNLEALNAPPEFKFHRITADGTFSGAATLDRPGTFQGTTCTELTEN